MLSELGVVHLKTTTDRVRYSTMVARTFKLTFQQSDCSTRTACRLRGLPSTVWLPDVYHVCVRACVGVRIYVYVCMSCVENSNLGASLAGGNKLSIDPS